MNGEPKGPEAARWRQRKFHLVRQFHLLAYCTERMDPETTRLVLASAPRQAKRNKVFENTRFIGLAVDGTGSGHTCHAPCPLCNPIKDPKGEVPGHLHHFVLIGVVGVGGLTLPVDVEPYGPGDSGYAAAQRLLRRAVDRLGVRFADYVVGHGEYDNRSHESDPAAGAVGAGVICTV